jgi:hypothetical protein
MDTYWKSKCRDGRIPYRSDIDPLDLRDLLPNLVIVDLSYDPFRVRYRLTGTKVQQFDEEFTNKFAEELENTNAEEKAEINRTYEASARSRSPLYFVRTYRSRSFQAPLTVHTGVWPLLTTGDHVGQAVAILDYINL